MRQVPFVYSQRDPRWAAQRLGTVDGMTIGQEGCYITCFSMTAGYFGHEITPNALDDICTQKGFYVQGNLCTDDLLTKVFPDIHYQQTLNYQNSPADLGKLGQLMSDANTLVILEVDFDHNPGDGIQTHFVLCVACDGTNVTIADPWYGTVDDFTLHYGTTPQTTIQKFVVYTGTPATQPSADTQQVIDALRQARDDNWNRYQTEVATNKTLSEQITALTGEVNDYKAKYEAEQQHTIELNGQLADASALMEKIKTESKDYGVQILDAQHERDAAKAELASEQARAMAQQHAQSKFFEQAFQTFLSVFWKRGR